MDIYVSNLSFQVDDAALRQFFADFGEVRKATVVKDRETGKSRGFGFVDMPDTEAANRAIADLNGRPLMGRPVNVTEARPRPPGGERRPMGTAAPIGSGLYSSGGASGPRPPGAPSPRPPSSGGGFGGPPRGGGFDDPGPSIGVESEERPRRLHKAPDRHPSVFKGKKPGARFEEVRRPKVLKGAGDDKWRPNKYTGEEGDDEEVAPPRVR